MAEDVKKTYGITLTTIGSIGFSAMMHGYMAFNKEGELLVPFRTWRNTITGPAAGKLTEVFRYNIPQRWSIAHLYQAILNKEEHVKDIDYLITLEGYVHWKLTGRRVLGIGDVAGMFPVDIHARDLTRSVWSSLTNWWQGRISRGSCGTSCRRPWWRERTQAS